MFTHTFAGHAGAPTSTRWFSLSMHWLHLVAIGGWIGGLAWLLTGIRGSTGAERSAPVERFSRLATVALAVVILTGVTRALAGIERLEQLRASDYGVALLVKLGLIVPLVVLGALNRFRIVPALARGRDSAPALKRSVRGELAFTVGVFAVTGVLAGLPPPGDEAEHLDHDAHDADDDVDETVEDGITVTESDFATSINVTLHVEPGVIGPNLFRVQVTDYDTGEALDVDRVALRFTIPERPDVVPTMLELEPGPEGWWEAEGTTTALPARWRATAIIAHATEGYEVPLEFEVGDHDGHDDHDVG